MKKSMIADIPPGEWKNIKLSWCIALTNLTITGTFRRTETPFIIDFCTEIEQSFKEEREMNHGNHQRLCVLKCFQYATNNNRVAKNQLHIIDGLDAAGFFDYLHYGLED